MDYFLVREFMIELPGEISDPYFRTHHTLPRALAHYIYIKYKYKKKGLNLLLPHFSVHRICKHQDTV